MEAYAESTGITKEVVQEVRKRNILPTKEPTKEKKAKPEVSTPKSRHSRSSTPSSGSLKPASSVKSKAKAIDGK